MNESTEKESRRHPNWNVASFASVRCQWVLDLKLNPPLTQSIVISSPVRLQDASTLDLDSVPPLIAVTTYSFPYLHQHLFRVLHPVSTSFKDDDVGIPSEKIYCKFGIDHGVVFTHE